MIEKIIEVLSYSLPFREHYFPTGLTILVYLIPLLIGFLIFITSKEKKIEKSLIFSVILIIPVLLVGIYQKERFNAMILSYYSLLLLLLIPLGSFIAYLLLNLRIRPAYNQQVEIQNHNPKNKYYLALSFIFIFLTILLNLIPFFNSNYLVGADVYFNAAISKNSFTEYNSVNPYFKESLLSPYFSQGFSLIKLLNSVTGISLNSIWLIFPGVCIGIFLMTLLALVRGMLGDKVAFLTVLFVAPLNQFLFNDPSMRFVAYIILMASFLVIWKYLLDKNKLNLVILGILLISLFFYHIELFVHLILVILFLIILLRIKFNFIKQNLSDSLDFRLITQLMLIFTLILILITSIVIKFSPIASIMTYNEIVFSLVYPVGVLSFIIGILGLLHLSNKNKFFKEDIFILAICFLALNSLFYFLLLWKFHHRYFIETAYIGFSIFAALFSIKLLNKIPKKYKIIFIISLIAITAISIYPRLIFSINYSQGVNDFVESKSETLSYLNELSKGENYGKVVLASPEDFINRYIPVYTDFFILSGFTNETLVILPFCGKYGALNETCRNREYLAFNFLSNPSKKNLNEIRKKYQLDFLVISKMDKFFKEDKFDSDLFEGLYSNDKYIVYKIKNENTK